MKSKCLCCGLMSAALWAQIPPTTAPTPPAAPITPDTVVASVDGKKFTAGDVRKMVGALPPQNQQHFAADPKEFLRQWVLLEKVATMAEKAKFDQQSPYKERLEYQRQLILSQAYIERQFELIPSSEPEWKAYYEKNKAMFSQAKLKVIYIPFNLRAPTPAPADAPKPMTEAEAKTQAEAALAEIRKGTDFAAVVKKYSKDATSAAKGGDFGTMKRSDSVPIEIKNAIFATKAGDTTAPIRHTNGFYLFHIDAIDELPYEQVKGDIDRLVKQEKFNKWFEELRNGIDLKIENQAFFTKPQGK